MTLKACCSNIFASIKRQIWLPALWFAALFFALPVHTALLLQSANNSPYSYRSRAEVLQTVFGTQSAILAWPLMLMAFVSALFYGAYMHKQKQVDFYHSQPVSRVRLLLQNAAAGLLTLFLPYVANLLLTVIVALAMGASAIFPWPAFFSGLAVHTLFFTAIFATALLAVVISGKSAVAAISGVFLLSLLPALLGLALGTAAEFYPTFYSDLYNWDIIVRWLSPAAAYAALTLDGPPYGLLPAGVYGALALTAALLLYRRRASEAASGAIAFKAARPLLKYAMACLAASVFAWIFYKIGNYGSGYFWLYFGAVTGGFLATQITEIVYAFDFRAVLRHLRGLAIFLIIYLSLLTVTIHDIGGYNAAVPRPAEVASAQIYLPGIESYAQNGLSSIMLVYQANAEQHALERSERDYLAMGPVTSPAAISAAVNIAARYAGGPNISEAQLAKWRQEGKQYLLNYLDEDYDSHTYGYINLNYTSCRVVFTLKSGRKMARNYSNTGIPVQFLLDDLAVIYGQADFRAAQLKELMFADERYAPQSLDIFELYYEQPALDWLSAEDRGNLLAALRADLLELSLEEQLQGMPIGALRLRLYGGPVDYPLAKGWLAESNRPCRVQNWPIYASFSRTLAFFAAAGYGPELWQPQLADIISVNLVDRNSGPYTEIFGYSYGGMAYESSGAPLHYLETPEKERKNITNNEITDPAIIAEIMSVCFPEQAPQYNCFIDIDRRTEVEVHYRGPGGLTYTKTRVFKCN